MTPAELGRRLAEASAHRAAGRWVEACAAYEAVLAAAPNMPDSWFNLALVRRRARRFEAALEAYGEALRRGVSGPEEARLNRAVILSEDLDRPDAAEAELREAVRLAPSYVPAWLNLGNLQEDRGKREAARDAYARALAIDPAHPLALARLAGATCFADAHDPLLVRLRARLELRALTAADRADLGFALGRGLDEAGDYDAAFDAYAAANAASQAASGARYDRAAAEHLIDRLIAAFPAGDGPTARPTGRAPLFICGPFRSGSTLAERILAAGEGVRSGGELDTLASLARTVSPWPEAAGAADAATLDDLARRYLAETDAIRPGAGLLTDKRPDNLLRLGLAKRMFPDARVVITRRDRRDLILSNWMLHLGPEAPQALDLADMAHWTGQEDRLIAHWRTLWPEDLLELDYDALVADPEPHARRLYDFAGLDWTPEALDVAARGGAVRTASVWQVREPLYRRSSGRWRNYAHRLGGLFDDAPDA